MSGLVVGRPGRRFAEPSYFLATSRRNRGRMVSGVTIPATAARRRRPRTLPFTARRRRWSSVRRSRWDPSRRRARGAASVQGFDIVGASIGPSFPSVEALFRLLLLNSRMQLMFILSAAKAPATLVGPPKRRDCGRDPSTHGGVAGVGVQRPPFMRSMSVRDGPESASMPVPTAGRTHESCSRR